MKFYKKGTESEMWPPHKIMFWLIFGVGLGLIAIFFVIIVSKAGSEQAKISGNIESLYLMQRFLKSPSCFAYDKEGIFMSGVIDSEKFTEERLNNCYKINEKLFPAFRITLSSESAKISNTIKTKNWNDNRNFELRKVKDVLVYLGNSLYNGELLIEVQNV